MFHVGLKGTPKKPIFIDLKESQPRFKLVVEFQRVHLLIDIVHFVKILSSKVVINLKPFGQNSKSDVHDQMAIRNNA